MKISLLVVGKTDVAFVRDGIDEYEKRVKRYVSYEMNVIPDVRKAKGVGEVQQKELEGTAILSHIEASDYVVLLDEHGKEYSSKEFAAFVQQRMSSGIKRLVFVVGGAYGFCDGVYRRANAKLSLSRMTFPHQLVRMFFAEQLYRAMTILKREPYHHE